MFSSAPPAAIGTCVPGVGSFKASGKDGGEIRVPWLAGPRPQSSGEETSNDAKVRTGLLSLISCVALGTSCTEHGDPIAERRGFPPAPRVMVASLHPITKCSPTLGRHQLSGWMGSQEVRTSSRTGPRRSWPCAPFALHLCFPGQRACPHHTHLCTPLPGWTGGGVAQSKLTLFFPW